MIRRIFLGALMVMALQAVALDVVNTAGSLQKRINSLDISDLKVSGTMNAVDFFFIADNLRQLRSVDLRDVEVLSCHLPKMRYWQDNFADGELPTGAFADMKVEGVVLPSGLTLIGKGAFAGCEHLTNIVLPASLEQIADYAFAGCSALPVVVLPASVKTVGTGAFMRCTALTSFTVESPSRLESVADAALMDCSSLQTLSLGNVLQTLGERALAGTAMRELDLTACRGLNHIGDWTAVLTPVQQVKLPDGVSYLGDGAFLYDTQLTGITLGQKLKSVNDYLLAGTSLAGELELSSAERVGDYALYNVSTLSSVSLPASVTWLGDSAMAGMTGLTSLACNAVKVPALGENVWAGVNQAAVPLDVPAYAVDRYKAAAQWQEFFFPESWLLGDINGDGEVSVADVNSLISILLGDSVDAETKARADINSDEEVTIADLNSLIDIILNKVSKMAAPVDTGDLLHLNDVSIEPGDTRTLMVTLDNAEAYSALQCDIALPQGLTLVKVTNPQGHEIETGIVDDGTMSRTMAYSMTKQSFDAEDAAVLCITVTADETLRSEELIKITNVVLADADNQAWHPDGCAARVTNTSGIEDLTVGDRLWLEGRVLCIECRMAGRAQVVAVNGMSRDLSLTAGENRQELDPGFYVVVLNGKSHKIAIK